jgi:hypothetical protein
MALVYPRQMTTGKIWIGARLYLAENQLSNFSIDGTLATVERGPAFWYAQYSTGPMPAEEAHSYFGELMNLRGSLRPFYLHTAKRPQPAAYDGEDLSGVTVLSKGAGTISLDGLPNSFQITPGDFFTATVSGEPQLYEFAEAGTADGSGETDLLSVSPTPRFSLSGGDTVTMINPFCKMRLEPKSLSISESSNGRRRVSFNAKESPL